MTNQKLHMTGRREALRLLSNAALGGALAASWPRAAPAAPPVDENLPDTSTYLTIRHPEIDPETNYVDFYHKLDDMTAETRTKLPHYLNLPYGTHVKQRIDLYLPQRTVRNAPVLTFFHGGSFEEGHRAHYGFVAQPYAARGIITAVAGYRLVPDGWHYPSQKEDVKATVGWLYRSIAQYGGNPNALYLSGHSAGAMMVADVGVNRSWMHDAGLPGAALRGFAAVSGLYDLTGSAGDSPARNAYTPTNELRAEASAVKHIDDPAREAVVAYGQGDAFERKLTQGSPEFVELLRAKGCDANLIVLPQAGHLAMVMAFATDTSPLFKAVASMVDEPVA